MTANQDHSFAGSIPEIYERLLVPLLFEPFAIDLVERLVRLKPSNVLELAAGTGAVTRLMARALPNASILATDLNQPMLNEAAQRVTASNVKWQHADALEVPLPDASFDVVVCQFGVMFFPDRTKGYREARRLLKPGGHLLFNTWERIERNPFTNEVKRALAAEFRDDPPTFIERVPHGYFDDDHIRRDLRAAGFDAATIEMSNVATETILVTAQSVATAFCQGTPIRNEIEARAAGRLDAVTARVTEAVTTKFGAKNIHAPIEAIVVKATK